MYHYVREIDGSKYPLLKGLEFNNFKKQIDFFSKNFNILDYFDFTTIIKNKKIPEKPSVLLTFDDGYIDHYQYVFPYLLKKKINGCFYPPILPLLNKMVLDVNKIHFILEKAKNKNFLIQDINFILKKLGQKQIQEYDYSKFSLKGLDDKKTLMIKRLLQVILPKKYREEVCDYLFEKYLNISLTNFSKELYMSKNQINEMSKNGMVFGSHTMSHEWLESLSRHQQNYEIKTSVNFLRNNVSNKYNYSLCYPYGSYNMTTINILKKYNIEFGLTSHYGYLNKKNIHNIYSFPRIDTAYL
jgi:peptidoglycan/xylan/chitin deacetylase (PgdA/CDA1 family)